MTAKKQAQAVRAEWERCIAIVADLANDDCSAAYSADVLRRKPPSSDTRAERAPDGLRERIVTLLDEYWGGENAIDRYDRIAELFYRETGYMRPGKSVPLEMSYSERQELERDAAWRKWAAKRVAKNEAEARALLALLASSDGSRKP